MRMCAFKLLEVNDQNRARHRCIQCQYVTVFIPNNGQRIYRRCNNQWNGLGDMIARAISVIGITQPRMEAWFGPCGCEERQERLNQVGWELSDRTRYLFHAALRLLHLALRFVTAPWR